MASYRRSRATALEIRDLRRRREQTRREQDARIAQLARSLAGGAR